MLQSVEDFCEHGLCGHHVLLEPHVLYQALDHPLESVRDADPITAEEVEALLDRLEAAPDIASQRRVISGASRRAQALFVRLYLEMLYRFLNVEATLH